MFGFLFEQLFHQQKIDYVFESVRSQSILTNREQKTVYLTTAGNGSFLPGFVGAEMHPLSSALTVLLVPQLTSRILELRIDNEIRL